MRQFLGTALIFFLLISCNSRKNNIKIEKFVWIQHNQNWIHTPDDLQARYYLEFVDSCNKIRLAKTRIKLKQSEYFENTSPDSLKELIISNLYSKKFPKNFNYRDTFPHIYDGDFYCIIYKFKNGEEHILNYAPFTIPDSLEYFANYLEKLSRLTSYEKTDSFDRTSLINKYRYTIIPNWPFAPPPETIDKQIKYVAPVIVDSITK